MCACVQILDRIECQSFEESNRLYAVLINLELINIENTIRIFHYNSLFISAAAHFNSLLIDYLIILPAYSAE